jgi:hypothetical protein
MAPLFTGSAHTPLPGSGTDTMEEFFFHCGIQRKRVFSVVGHNGKNYTTQNDIFKFKCLSLPSNKNFGKITYLNCQTNPWKELKMENYMINHEKKCFFPLWDITQQRFFKFLNLNNFTKINFSAK